MDDPHLKVLQMIQDGTISAEEGERLLEALGEGGVAPQQEGVREEEAAGTVEVLCPETGHGAVVRPAPEAEPPSGAPRWWRRAWVYVLAGGVALLAAGGIWTGWLARGNAGLGWLGCTVPLLILGTAVVLLAWWARVARWLHLRVRDGDKDIGISMPLPLRLAAWVLRVIRPWVPKLRETAVDELIMAMAEEPARGNILAVEVNDDEDDEEVKIYIG